jgi:hypothetical protein
MKKPNPEKNSESTKKVSLLGGRIVASYCSGLDIKIAAPASLCRE